ncbi:TetR/AcrR family transcriptional regulator [Aestuariicella hydrocarbonica]|uniref:TetR/AcrR family transcriptional regulator n=1 Tax=Pseudomaricurvus hydrocarbonicus TaxID=1470433 RepID=A0A9E5T1G5_9GAMM|nr:TetR/AcrR family transcriptional regulator [Aestuariicella hydrocarbonica]NHO67410.1 TetR/AcrR family transcriptional regulator [Aestuariicella hydrocarbonica]
MTPKTDPHTQPKEDARKTRSREAIDAAFLRLLEHKSLDQISVREIAQEAGIGHATFYRHYTTKEELLDVLAADEIQRMVDLSLPLMQAEDTMESCLAQCRYIDKHRTLWTTLLTGGAASTVKEELLRIAREVASQAPIPAGAHLPRELSTILTVTAMIETISWWLQQKKPLAVNKIARYIHQIITANAFV